MARSSPQRKFFDVATMEGRLEDLAAPSARLASAEWRDETARDPDLATSAAAALAAHRLESRCRDEERWNDLLELLLGRAEYASSDEEAAMALSEAAEVCRGQGDFEGERLILLTAFRRRPGDRGLMNRLEAAARASGGWDELIDIYVVAAAELAPSALKSELWLRVFCATLLEGGELEEARAALDKIGPLDPESADLRSYLDDVEGRLKSALELELVAAACGQLGDEERRLRLAKRALGAAGPHGRALAEAPVTSAEGDDTAVANLEILALRASNDPLRTALELEERFYRDERWRELVPLYAFLLEELGVGALGDDADDLRFRAGRCAAECGELELAAAHFEELLAARPDCEPADLELARIEARRGDWGASSRRLERIIAGRRERLADRVETAPLEAELGHLYRAVNHDEEAMLCFRRAIAISPLESGAALALAEMVAARGDHETALRLRRELGEALPLALQVENLCAMAEMRAGVDRDAAIELYRRALRLEPLHAGALRATVELYTASSKWREAVDALVKLAPLADGAPAARAAIHRRAALIARDKLDALEAVQHFEAALDCTFAGPCPGERERELAMRSFTDLVRIFYEYGDFSELQRQYRRMVDRLDPADPLSRELWRDLDHLHREEFRAAIPGATGDLERASGAEMAEMERAPLDPKGYEALFASATGRGDRDRAWCAARALAFLGAETTESARCYEEGRDAKCLGPRRAWTNETWEALSHSGVLELAPLLRPLGTALAATLASDAGPGCTAEPDERLASLWRRLETSLCAPALPRRTVTAGGIRFARVDGEFALLLPASAAEPLSGAAETFARAAAMSRPEALLGSLLCRDGDLEVALLAAVRVCRSDSRVETAKAESVAALAELLRPLLGPGERTRLAQAVDEWLAAKRPADIAAYRFAAEATARRASLLVTGDLALVASRLPGGQIGAALLGDLLVHSTSEVHGHLRRLSGRAFEPG